VLSRPPLARSHFANAKQAERIAASPHHLFRLQFRVKMTTADDEKTTDIVVEGDKEEIERFCKVRSTARSDRCCACSVLECHSCADLCDRYRRSCSSQRRAWFM